MTLGEYIHKVDTGIRQEIETYLNTVIASSAVAFIDTRIRQRGEKAEGGQFKPYSSKPSLIGAKSFTSKVHADKVFGKTKNRSLEWVTYRGHKLAVMPGGYKQIREVEGRQTGHKDFERTSELWKSIHVMGTSELSPGRYQTKVGTENPRSVSIMEGILDREGSEFLGVSESEKEKLTNYLANKLQTIMS